MGLYWFILNIIIYNTNFKCNYLIKQNQAKPLKVGDDIGNLADSNVFNDNDDVNTSTSTYYSETSGNNNIKDNSNIKGKKLVDKKDIKKKVGLKGNINRKKI